VHALTTTFSFHLSALITQQQRYAGHFLFVCARVFSSIAVCLSPQLVTYFWLKNPKSKTKVLKIGGDNGSTITGLRIQIAKHTSSG
jgi:hypothetical protein